MAKTVRFTKVVERSGEPRAHTLWVAPEKDPEFKRAVQANRVMTIESGGPAGKTDVGVVGFEAGKSAGGQFLIFPKSLKAFEDARVVGVKFDLVAQPRLEAVTEAWTAPPKRKGGKKDVRPVPIALVPLEPAQAEGEPAEEARNETKVVAMEFAPAPPTPPPRGGGRTAAAKKPAKASPPPPRERPAPTHAILIREVRAALKELEKGKAVAAYQRLQRALEKTPSS